MRTTALAMPLDGKTISRCVLSSTHTWLAQLADDAARPTEIDVATLQSSSAER